MGSLMTRNKRHRSPYCFQFREESTCNENYYGQHIQITEDEFAQECLRSHNHFRAKHGCPPLHLSVEVSKFSQKWADQLSKEDHFYHSHHPKYGENLFVTYLSDNSLPMAKGSEVVESWYSENVSYPFGGRVSRETVYKTGHFTQVIWSSSRELGIGKAISKSNRVYVVANYYPAGNIMNKFADNVPKTVHCTRPSNVRQHHYSKVSTRTFTYRDNNYLTLDKWILQ